jgi:TonB family protein
MEKVSKIRLPLTPCYGAAEIKLAIRKNTYRAFLITMAGLAAVLMLSLLTGSVESKETAKRKFNPIELIEIVLQKTEQKLELKTIEPPKYEDLTEIINHGPKEIFSRNLKGVEELEADSNAPDLASLESIDKAGSKPGDGLETTDEGFELHIDNTPKDQGVEIKDTPDGKERPEYFSPDVPPSVDLDELRRNIVYPEIARQIGTSGKVIVKVWINENGLPEDPVILKSDSKLLEEEALRVVRLPVYTPGINKSKPVGCWIVIPIHFKLSD